MMDQVLSTQQAKEYAEAISGKNYTFNELGAKIQGESSIAQSLILWFLDFKDEAKDKINTTRVNLGEEVWVQTIEPFLSPDTFELLINVSANEFVMLRTSGSDVLVSAAREYLSPILKNISPTEKLYIVKNIMKDKISCNYLSHVYDMNLILIELFSELDIDPKVRDEKTKMAMEYAIEPVSLILDANESELFWRLESQVVAQIESFWDNVKLIVVNLTKNTVGNPTVRKYAVAGIALGVALAATDSFAASDVSVFDLDSVKEYFTSVDDYFNETVLPKHGFNDGCEVSSKIVSQTANEVSAEITIGDRKILVDVQSSMAKGKGFSHASSGIKTEVLRMPGIKSSCNMDKDTYINLAKAISKQINLLKR